MVEMRKGSGKKKASGVSKGSNVLCIPDLHEPFTHRDFFEFCLCVKREFNANSFVFLGDEADFHAISDYDSDADGYSAGHELRRVRKSIAKWYDEYPNALVCESNHTSRPIRKMVAAGIPSDLIPTYKQILDIPDSVDWRYAQSHIVDGVVYEHGDACGGMYPHANAMRLNMMSTVVGHHHHAFGIHWNQSPYRRTFGMAVGCGIDAEAYAFRYARMHKKKPMLGCAMIIGGEPMLFRMNLNAANRWDRKINIVDGQIGS
jgi:hypothetical protein